MISDLGNERARRRLSEEAIDDYIAKVDNMAVSEKDKRYVKSKCFICKKEKKVKPATRALPFINLRVKRIFSLLFK